MTLFKGDVVQVTQTSNPNWYFGFVIAGRGYGQSGAFPPNYVGEILPHADAKKIRSWVSENLITCRRFELLFMHGALQGELAAPGRYVIRQGLLGKKCGLLFENRYFFLFNDCIVYAKHVPAATQCYDFKRKMLLTPTFNLVNIPGSKVKLIEDASNKKLKDVIIQFDDDNTR